MITLTVITLIVFTAAIKNIRAVLHEERETAVLTIFLQNYDKQNYKFDISDPKSKKTNYKLTTLSIT